MYWHQLAKGLKQLMAKAPFPLSLAQGVYPQPDNSNASSPPGNDPCDEEEMTPYSPDSNGERSDSSLHLSC